MESNLDQITPQISEVFEIDSISWGTNEQQYIVRYQGILSTDSEEAYEVLNDFFHPRNMSILFRVENGTQTIVIKNGIPKKAKGNPKANIVLFILTLLSMMIAGALYSAPAEATPNNTSLVLFIFSLLPSGGPFAISLLAILTAHEFGHYFAAKYHKSDVSLPYFLPFPFSPFGTLGAFIQLKSHPKNRKVLHDIGVAGPLAGLLVTIPVLFYGLSLSSLDTLPLMIPEGVSFSLEGNSIFYLFSKFLVFGEWLPAPHLPEINGGIQHWLSYLFTGLPTPLGGTDVFLHPIAWAGWAGLLVTSLNLIPAGQLDGGHILYVLLGDKAKKAIPFILFFLVLLGFAWQGWWLWVVLISLMGRSHAQPSDQITQLDKTRKIIAITTLLIFVLIFMPIPLKVIIGPYIGP